MNTLSCLRASGSVEAMAELQKDTIDIFQHVLTAGFKSNLLNRDKYALSSAWQLGTEMI